MNDNDSWLERAKRLAGKSPDPPTIDKAALARRANQSTAQSAALLEKQRQFSRHIATGAVSKVMRELVKVLGGEAVQPMIEEHHKRMLSVTADIKGKPVVVNILSLPTGKIRLTCFIGMDGEGEER